MKHLLELANYLLCVQYANILRPIIMRILELFQFDSPDITHHPLFDALLSPLCLIPDKFEWILVDLIGGHLFQYFVDPSRHLSHHIHPLRLVMQEVLRVRLHLLVPFPVLLIHFRLHSKQLRGEPFIRNLGLLSLGFQSLFVFEKKVSHLSDTWRFLLIVVLVVLLGL